MESVYNFNLLKSEFQSRKNVILFVGAGINQSAKVDLSWNTLLAKLFNVAFGHFSVEKNLDSFSMDTIRKEINGGNTNRIDELKANLQEKLRLTEYFTNEFPSLVKASIIKEILGESYIETIRYLLYSECNKHKLYESFSKCYGHNKSNNTDVREFYTMYQLARLVLLRKNIKAVITYNYDNFFTQAINILSSYREEFFRGRELEIVEQRNLFARDVAGAADNDRNSENELLVYHVHGYIPSPSECVGGVNNDIVLSMDEYYENTRNVYSWQSATQLHYLSHYTCILAGMSLSDITPQRMIYYAVKNGSRNNIYYLMATENKDNRYASVYQALTNMKMSFFKNFGLIPIYTNEGFKQLYGELDKLVNV